MSQCQSFAIKYSTSVSRQLQLCNTDGHTFHVISCGKPIQFSISYGVLVQFRFLRYKIIAASYFQLSIHAHIYCTLWCNANKSSYILYHYHPSSQKVSTSKHRKTPVLLHTIPIVVSWIIQIFNVTIHIIMTS